MYDIIHFDEQEKWHTEVQSMEFQDVYFDLEYCLLYQLLGDGDPYLFVYTEGNNKKVIYPFLKRQVKNGPLSGRYFDITTPYGYGGPLANCSDPAFIKNFRSEFHTYCTQEKIVTEFIRFHPLLHNEHACKPLLNVQYVRDTVVVDLRCDDLMARYHPSHRRNVRKAWKANLTFNVFEGSRALAEMDTFIALYRQTMQKNNAQSYYYFPKRYFERMINHLSEQVMMAVIKHNDIVVAAGLFMHKGENLHYHLGCSDRDYLHLAPNNLLFHQVSLWGKQNGCTLFHLGGGYRHNDSLFRFKLGFNPLGRRGFYVGKMVHNQAVYNDLIQLWKKTHTREWRQDYFPLYRQ